MSTTTGTQRCTSVRIATNFDRFTLTPRPASPAGVRQTISSPQAPSPQALAHRPPSPVLACRRSPPAQIPQLPAQSSPVTVHEKLQRQVGVDRFASADHDLVGETILRRDLTLGAQNFHGWSYPNTALRLLSIVPIVPFLKRSTTLPYPGRPPRQSRVQPAHLPWCRSLPPRRRSRTRHVEIVNHHVQKKPARRANIRDRRRRRIAAHDVHQRRLADLSPCHGAAHAPEIQIESPIKID